MHIIIRFKQIMLSVTSASCMNLTLVKLQNDVLRCRLTAWAVDGAHAHAHHHTIQTDNALCHQCLLHESHTFELVKLQNDVLRCRLKCLKRASLRYLS
jgi:hypothetical protein